MIKDAFYALTAATGEKLRDANLTAAEWRIWSYLIEIDAWGDTYKEFSTIVLLAKCSVSKATFYRAIAKFQELELFDFQDNGFSVRNRYGVSSLKNETTVAEMRQDSQICENRRRNEKVVAEMRQDSQSCENQTPEPLHSKESQTPQTLKIKKDTKDTTEAKGGALKIFERYEKKLKLYSIHKNIFKEGEIIPNPKMESILQAIALISEEEAEQNIKAFIDWASRTTGVKDVYAAFRAAILKGWRG